MALPLFSLVRHASYSQASFADIKSNFTLLDRAVSQFDARFSLRALRSISSLRKRLTPDILAQVISETFVPSSPSAIVAKQLLLLLTESPSLSAGSMALRWI